VTQMIHMGTIIIYRCIVRKYFMASYTRTYQMTMYAMNSTKKYGRTSFILTKFKNKIKNKYLSSTYY